MTENDEIITYSVLPTQQTPSKKQHATEKKKKQHKHKLLQKDRTSICNLYLNLRDRTNQ